MTREQYLLIRDSPEVPMAAWFEFYKEKGGVIDDPAEFEKIFSIALANESHIPGTDGTMKQITLKSALDKFYTHYNEKFGV